MVSVPLSLDSNQPPVLYCCYCYAPFLKKEERVKGSSKPQMLGSSHSFLQSQ